MKLTSYQLSLFPEPSLSLLLKLLSPRHRQYSDLCQISQFLSISKGPASSDSSTNGCKTCMQPCDSILQIGKLRPSKGKNPKTKSPPDSAKTGVEFSFSVFIFSPFVMLGVDPRGSHMLGRYPITELHNQLRLNNRKDALPGRSRRRQSGHSVWT